MNEKTLLWDENDIFLFKRSIKNMIKVNKEDLILSKSGSKSKKQENNLIDLNFV